MEKGSPIHLLAELMQLYEYVLKIVCVPTTFPNWSSLLEFDFEQRDNVIPFSAMYFGAAFFVESEAAVKSNKLNLQSLEEVKNRCKDYVIELFRQIKTRLPVNVEQLQSVSELAPSVVLGPRKPNRGQLSFIGLYKGDLAKLQQQWDRLGVIRWNITDDGNV